MVSCLFDISISRIKGQLGARNFYQCRVPKKGLLNAVLPCIAKSRFRDSNPWPLGLTVTTLSLRQDPPSLASLGYYYKISLRYVWIFWSNHSFSYEFEYLMDWRIFLSFFLFCLLFHWTTVKFHMHLLPLAGTQSIFLNLCTTVSSYLAFVEMIWFSYWIRYFIYY